MPVAVANASKIPVITLTTDFGLRDYFVGVLKGVLLQSLPLAHVIDITHEIAPHDVISASFVVQETFRYFPEGTVHLVVVDPGVGTSRRKLVVTLCGQYFVAPDNGILTILLKMKGSRVFEIGSNADLKSGESPTFAARDHFAPIAATLAKGIKPGDLGKEIFDAHQIDDLTCKKAGTRISGKIVYFDRFGNGITNITRADLEEGSKTPENIKVELQDKRFIVLKGNYASGEENEVFAIINSSGHMEISSRNRSAQQILKLKLMDNIIVN